MKNKILLLLLSLSIFTGCDKTDSIDNKLKSSFNIVKAKELIQKLLNKDEKKKIIKFETRK